MVRDGYKYMETKGLKENNIKNNKYVIFIPISQAFIIRNVLRSGGYKMLRLKGYKLVIFLNSKSVPDYLKKEFSDSILIPFYDSKVSGIHRIFIKFTHFLLYTKTTRRYFKYSKHYIEKSRFIVFLYLILLRSISIFAFFIKPIIRFVEPKLFPEVYNIIEEYFEKYNPIAVFSTSITSKMDNIFLKAGKRRKIITISMPKSWDTVTKMYYRFLPDYFIAQNEILKKQLAKLQNFPQNKITVIGFPQFDWYRNKSIIRSRDEHLKKLGLDPNLPVIFFGSQGSWYNKDYLIADKIYDWVKNDELIYEAQFLVRPHFTNVKDKVYTSYKNKKKASYDDTYNTSEIFRDNWDPSTEETIDFVNTIYHSSVMVIILSTLALDGACVDKPVINTLFSAKFRKGKDITPVMKYTNHYDWVLKTGATFQAHNFEDLKKYINIALKNPDVKHKERELLLEKVCYKVDGKSSHRMVEAIHSIIKNHR